MRRLTVGLVVLGFLTGCTVGRHDFDVMLSSNQLDPGHPIEVHYWLPEDAHIFVGLEDGRGHTYVVRNGEMRAAGSYTLTLRNVVDRPDLGPSERRALGAGSYTLKFRVQFRSGSVVEKRSEVQVTGARASAPVSIEDLRVSSPVLSPNDDGVNDEAEFEFRLSRDAWVTAYVEGSWGRLTLISGSWLPSGVNRVAFKGRDPRDMPIPDGQYQFTLVAEDTEGNRTASGLGFAVRSSALAQATIRKVVFEPLVIGLGQIVRVEVTVTNTGRVPVRTQGPDPGYLYTMKDTFSTVEDHKYVERLGMWRVGVDWESNVGAGPRRYPFRWGFGHDLSPGETVTVVGFIMVDQFVSAYSPYLTFFAGLVQEGMGYPVDKVGRTVVQVRY